MQLISVCASDLALLSLFFIGNTDIITNSFINLFICDLDEFLYKILMVCPLWVKSMSRKEQIESDGELFNQNNGLKAPSHEHGGSAQTSKAKW